MSVIKYRIELNQLLPENPVTVEIGVAEGYFSQHICENWKPSIHYCVDSYTNHENSKGDCGAPQEWHDMNLAIAKWKLYNSRHLVRWMRGISWEMSKEIEDYSIDFLYLDAGHDYESVKKDLHAWYNKVKRGGIIAGHDFLNRGFGVKQAVMDFCAAGKFHLNVIREDKDQDAGFYFVNTKNG